MNLINYSDAESSGIAIFPVISLVIFFIVFVAMILYAMLRSKKEMIELNNLPFDNEKTDSES